MKRYRVRLNKDTSSNPIHIHTDHIYKVSAFTNNYQGLHYTMEQVTRTLLSAYTWLIIETAILKLIYMFLFCRLENVISLLMELKTQIQASKSSTTMLTDELKATTTL